MKAKEEIDVLNATTYTIKLEEGTYLLREPAPDLWEVSETGGPIFGTIARIPAEGRNKERWRVVPTGMMCLSQQTAIRALALHYWQDQATAPLRASSPAPPPAPIAPVQATWREIVAPVESNVAPPPSPPLNAEPLTHDAELATEWLPIAQAASLYGRSPSALMQDVHAQRIPGRQVPGYGRNGQYFSNMWHIPRPDTTVTPAISASQPECEWIPIREAAPLYGMSQRKLAANVDRGQVLGKWLSGWDSRGGYRRKMWHVLRPDMAAPVAPAEPPPAPVAESTSEPLAVPDAVAPAATRQQPGNNPAKTPAAEPPAVPAVPIPVPALAQDLSPLAWLQAEHSRLWDAYNKLFAEHLAAIKELAYHQAKQEGAAEMATRRQHADLDASPPRMAMPAPIPNGNGAHALEEIPEPAARHWWQR